MSVKKGLVLGFVLTLAFVIAFPGGTRAAEDSAEVSNLLLQAKQSALQLENDAQNMQTFTRQKFTWQSHASEVSKIQQDVNHMGDLINQLNQKRGGASSWQQQAIDRVNPLMKEMASNVTATITYLNKHPERLQAANYRDYLEANADIAANLSTLISDFVEYGKTKEKLDELAQKLEIS